MSEPLRLRFLIDCGVEELEVELAGGLPRLPREGLVSDDDLAALAATDARAMCGTHVETVNRTYHDRASPESWYSGVAEGLAVRQWKSLLESWRENQDVDSPRLALIVRIAQQFASKLEAICRRPRKVLRRVRAYQRPERVRILDPACLRWLSRQPGRSHFERAGPKQRMLSVVRLESADTTENRVARDFLVRCRRACDDYVFENRTRREAQRVREVRKFRALVNRLLVDTEVGMAGELVGVPEPNYVLLYEQRYQTLWTWYQRLKRQQDEQDNVWHWRHRVWAETCLLALGSCLEAAQDNAGGTRGYEGVIYLRNEQDAGQFLDGRSAPGPWIVDAPRGPRQVHLILPALYEALVAEHPPLERLTGLCPDYLLVSHDPGGDLVEGCWLGVWTALDFGIHAESAQGKRLETLRRALREVRSDLRVRGLLLQPSLRSSEGRQAGAGADPEVFGDRDCLAYSLPLPLTECVEWVELAVREHLGLGLW